MSPVASLKRSVVILPGLGNNKNDYDELSQDLRECYDFHVEVVPVRRLDWARNASGLFDRNYWRSTLSPRPTVDWYLSRVNDTVSKVREENEGPVTILAHSAGGWLGRLYLLDFGFRGIDRFVSLGSPHTPPPPGVVDQTRGILTFISQQTPGAFHEEIDYTTVAGKFIKGAKLFGKHGSLGSKVTGLGYQQVCGDPEVWGDGVVPIPSAHLDGALQINLDGVYHSPLGSSMPADQKVSVEENGNLDSDDFDESDAATSVGRPWYGSKSILPLWVECINSTPSTLVAD